MQIEVFWNKAIEHHCLTAERETVFIPISEDSLTEVYNNYLESLSPIDLDTIISAVNECRGIENSYFKSIKKAFYKSPNVTNCFLLFSFFVLCDYENEARSYWDNFDAKLHKITTQKLYNSERTDLIDKIVNHLKLSCRRKEKYFLDLNIYGKDHKLKNIGRIRAHSIFTSPTIRDVKKALYELGLAYTRSVEDLTDEEITKILFKANLPRVQKIFSSTDDIKGLVNECLTIWLKDWEPSEEEERSYHIERTSYEKLDTKLKRIWYWNRANNEMRFEWVYGFISKEKFGESGSILLNREKDIYINLDRSHSIGENRYLYIIDNLNPNIDSSLSNDDYHLKLARPKQYNQTVYALRNIKNTYYYEQVDGNKVRFSDEVVFLASENEIVELHNNQYFGGVFSSDPNMQFNVYRIQESKDCADFNFIKVNTEIDLNFNGISAGIQGRTAYLHSYPLKIIIGNIPNGLIEIYNSNDELIKTYDTNQNDCKLTNSIQLEQLQIGEYIVKVKKNDNKYIIFKDGYVFKKLEIFDEGNGDRRDDFFTNTTSIFRYSPPQGRVELEHLNSDWHLLFDIKTDKLNHKLFDFYFKKDRYGRWYIGNNNSLYFAAVLDNNYPPQRKNQIDYNNPEAKEFTYLDTEFRTYSFKVKPLSRFQIPIKINAEMYISGQFRVDQTVYCDCFCFELDSFDDQYQQDDRTRNINSQINILSNHSIAHDPLEIIRVITQERFPFKAKIKCRL